MKILVLDDDHNRLAQFEKKYSGHDVTCVETVGEAISELEINDFDVLFLDHDLGGEVYVDSMGQEETGYLVACWLSENQDKKPDRIIIHSLNYAGAENIQAVLPEAEKVPFISI